MGDKLTKRESYTAMLAFLEETYQRTDSDDLGMLLGGMSLLPDGRTADPAAWTDWEAAVSKVREHNISLDLDLRDDE